MSDQESDNQTNSSKSSSDNEELETTQEERDKIREKISTLSFEDLLKMKEQMGSKVYNETVYGISQTKIKRDFKRANKNRPREMSSKIRPKKLKRELNTSIAPKTAIPRDPRFDPLCGQFDDKIFKSNYKFVNDIRQQEKKQLRKELETCTNIERKKTIKLLIQRMDNQIREQQKKETEDRKKHEEQKNIREKLKKGEKPGFKKKSIKKLEGLIEKYEELKKTNKLQKHIEKRSKKLSSRDRKKFIKQDLL